MTSANSKFLDTFGREQITSSIHPSLRTSELHSNSQSYREAAFILLRSYTEKL